LKIIKILFAVSAFSAVKMNYDTASDGRGGVRVTLITLPFIPSRQGRGIVVAKRCPTPASFAVGLSKGVAAILFPLFI